MADQGTFIGCLYSDFVIFALAFEEREAFLDTKNAEVNYYCQNDRCTHCSDEIDVIQRDDHQNEIDNLGAGSLFTK